jgi:hypothetical protein
MVCSSSYGWLASLLTIKRPTEERGTANHGWLKTFHTFSFANYQSRRASPPPLSLSPSLTLTSTRHLSTSADSTGFSSTFHLPTYSPSFLPSFSLALPPISEFNNFAALRVINEDRVEPNEGFGTHGHAEFEIFSYVSRLSPPLLLSFFASLHC